MEKSSLGKSFIILVLSVADLQCYKAILLLTNTQKGLIMIKSYFKKILGTQSKKSTSYLDLPFFNYSQGERVGVDSYKNNAIVHRCVNLIATSASHIPWQIFRNSNGSKELLKNHPILGLLKYPSPEKSGADFFTENLSSLLLYGDSYLLVSFKVKLL